MKAYIPRQVHCSTSPAPHLSLLSSASQSQRWLTSGSQNFGWMQLPLIPYSSSTPSSTPSPNPTLSGPQLATTPMKLRRLVARPGCSQAVIGAAGFQGTGQVTPAASAPSQHADSTLPLAPSPTSLLNVKICPQPGRGYSYSGLIISRTSHSCCPWSGSTLLAAPPPSTCSSSLTAQSYQT